MRLSGYDPIAYGSVTYNSKTRTRSVSAGFLEQLQQAQETKKAQKPLSIDQARDILAGSGLQAIYDRLSPEARNALERINTGDGGIGKEEWNGLCNELRDTGALTDEDVMYSRSNIHLIPVGYTDANGNFVTYEPSFLKDAFLEKCGTRRDGNTLWDLRELNDWGGDPLKYLDDWASSLSDWRKELTRQRTADGSPAYNNYEGIDRQVDACHKVSDLVRSLSKLSKSAGA